MDTARQRAAATSQQAKIHIHVHTQMPTRTVVQAHFIRAHARTATYTHKHKNPRILTHNHPHPHPPHTNSHTRAHRRQLILRRLIFSISCAKTLSRTRVKKQSENTALVPVSNLSFSPSHSLCCIVEINKIFSKYSFIPNAVFLILFSQCQYLYKRVCMCVCG